MLFMDQALLLGESRRHAAPKGSRVIVEMSSGMADLVVLQSKTHVMSTNTLTANLVVSSHYFYYLLENKNESNADRVGIIE